MRDEKTREEDLSRNGEADARVVETDNNYVEDQHGYHNHHEHYNSRGHHHSHHQGRMSKKNAPWTILKTLLLIVQAVMSVMLVVSLLALGVLEMWLVMLIVIGLFLLLFLNLLYLIIKRRTPVAGQIVCALIGVFVIVGSVIAMRYCGAFTGFLGKITKKNPEYKEYSVLVLDDSSVEEIGELSGKGAGLLKNDSTASLAEQKLKGIVELDTNTYDGVFIMDEMMDNSLLDAMVLESGRVEILKEEAADVMSDKKVIYTFTIELPEDNKAAVEKEVAKEPFLVYISGMDSRSGLGVTSLSDVNIVVAVNPEDGRILLASVPRDTYVQLHGTTGRKDKLTHAGLYGINMSKTTMEDLLNIHIDHTIRLSFDAVVKIVDELGGIEVYSDTPMSLKAGGSSKICTFIEGKQWIDGVCALRFARERKMYYTGDIHRGANQQEVLTGIINKLSGSKDYVLRLPEILDAAAESIETSLSQEDIASFIRMQLSKQTVWQVKSIALTGEPDRVPTYSMGEDLILYVMHPNADSVKELHDTINEYLEQ